MAHAGQVIRNPVTGETVTFLVTAADSNGALLELEMEADPRAAGATTHIHPRITERYEMLEGRLHVTLEGVETVVAAGQRLEIRPRTAHSFRNADDAPARVRVRFEPAGRFEEFMETIYALASQGKTNAQSRPPLLQAALIGRRHVNDIALARPPVFVQRLLYALLAPIARMRGYRARSTNEEA
jgi:mannose-6-phosphate isomerase-like protein (cupin superfamily)